MARLSAAQVAALRGMAPTEEVVVRRRHRGRMRLICSI